MILRRRFEIGTVLAVEPLGSGQDTPSLLLAKVVRVQAQPKGEWLLGCKLMRKLEEEQISALK